MTVLMNDLKTPIGEILQAVGAEGGLLNPPGNTRYALLPLDEDLIDYLLERSPKFMSECREIRREMQKGHFHSHEEVKRMLTNESAG